MRTLNVLLATLVLSLFAGLVQARDLTEQDVRDVAAKMDAAIAQKDAQAYGLTLSEGVQVEVSFSFAGKTDRNTMNKAQYLAELRNGWSVASNYIYKRSNERIELAGKTATLYCDVLEGMTMGGRYVRARSRTTATIEMVDGKPLVTRMVAVGSM